jgi:hypothetical protein
MTFMQPPPAEPTPFAKFQQLAKAIMSVPKSEIDRREEQWKEANKDKPKRGPKPS